MVDCIEKAEQGLTVGQRQAWSRTLYRHVRKGEDLCSSQYMVQEEVALR